MIKSYNDLEKENADLKLLVKDFKSKEQRQSIILSTLWQEIKRLQTALRELRGQLELIDETTN